MKNLIILTISILFISCENYPDIYGPREIRTGNQIDCRAMFGSEMVEDNGKTVVVPAWREMEAHYLGHALIFEPKPNGIIFKEMKLLVFDRPSDTYYENLNVRLYDEDFTWMEKYDNDHP